jgi:DegV family protein with EDD domain
MNFKIVADSACDINEEIKRKTNISLTPLNLTLDEHQYIDDENLDIKSFLEDMKNSPVAPKSASPSPAEFFKRYEDAENVFVVTLSSKISSTYSNALLAKDMFLENHPNIFIHVFDSLSASVGETLVSLKIYELAKNNLMNSEIVEKVNKYISEMKTFFIYDSLDHLIKSGRLNKLKGTLSSILSIKPIMGSSPEGTIDLVEKVRGANRAFNRLIEIIGEKGEQLEDKILGIAYCNCLEKALSFKEEVLKRYKFKDIIIVEMGATISSFADEGGILIAF